MVNGIVANLHNTKTNRFHPILFEERPTLSGFLKHRSRGHHTDGFDERKHAIEYCETLASRHNCRLCVDKDFPWDGEDVPAMVVYFTEVDGKLVPMM